MRIINQAAAGVSNSPLQWRNVQILKMSRRCTVAAVQESTESMPRIDGFAGVLRNSEGVSCAKRDHAAIG